MFEENCSLIFPGEEHSLFLGGFIFICACSYVFVREQIREEKIRGDCHALGVEGGGACDRPAPGGMSSWAGLAWPLGTLGPLVLQLMLAPANIYLVYWFYGLY